MFFYDNGIGITNSALWLDATRRVDTCVVSHAHLDHARKHKLIIATEPTLQFLKKRIGLARSVGLQFGEKYAFDGGDATLYPAGHILGSAQTLINVDGRRLLYSGDFNMETSATAEPIEVPECDILIMESTFGQPQFRFPERMLVIEQLLEFVAAAFRRGCVPVVAGYTLGKTQEAMKILGDAGFELSVHGSVAVLAQVYENFGVNFGQWQKHKKTELEGKVLIIPRIALRSRLVQKLERKQVVFLTGWAVNPKVKQREGLDDALPLSDHADFDGLIAYARQTKAKKIYTTHGPGPFHETLRGLGFNASPLAALNT